MKIKLIDYTDKVHEISHEDNDINLNSNIILSFSNNEFRITNLGNPDNWGAYTYTPEPFYFKSIIAIGVPSTIGPSLYPFDCSYISYSNGTTNDWVIVAENHFKHSHKRYPLSTTYHHIDGGDTFHLRFIPFGNFANPIPSFEAEVLSILNINQDLYNNPYVSSILKLYDLNLSSLNINALSRNFGWRMIPDNFVNRYKSINKDFVKGWYGFGTTHSAGEGFTNEHYDHVLWWFLNGMLNGNSRAYDLGIELLNKKVNYGFINCKNNILWKYWWRGEKGNRRGELMPPAAAKEWDIGLIVGAILTQNIDLFEVCYKRLESLLNRTNANIWNGAGGGRMIGNYLTCMMAYHKFADLLHHNKKAEIESKVNNFLTHVFQKVGTNSHFPNIYSSNSYPVWEEATAYSNVYKWCKLLGRDMTKIKSMVKWLIDNGSGYPHPGYFGVAKDIMLQTGQKIFTTPNTAAWWVPIWEIAKVEFPGEYDALGVQATNNCYNNIGLTWAEIAANKAPLAPDKINVDLGAYGASAEKQWPILLTPLVNL